MRRISHGLCLKNKEKALDLWLCGGPARYKVQELNNGWKRQFSLGPVGPGPFLRKRLHIGDFAARIFLKRGGQQAFLRPEIVQQCAIGDAAAAG